MAQVSSQAFGRDPSLVLAMAKDEPVFVLDQGRPSVVLVDIAEYERLTGGISMRDALSARVELDLEPVVDHAAGRVADL